MNLGQHQQAFARDFARLLVHGFELGYEARIGELQRPPEMQLIYVQTGRSKTMDSDHLKKCAGDVHWFEAGVLCYPPELGMYWESLSPLNRWGGNFKTFKDAPHYERHVP